MRFSPVIYMFTILSKLPQKGCHWCDDCTNTKPNTILNNSQYQETKLKTKPNTIPSNTKQYTIPNQTKHNTKHNTKQYQTVHCVLFGIVHNTQYKHNAKPKARPSNTKQFTIPTKHNIKQYQTVFFRFSFALRAVHQRVVWMHGLVIQWLFIL